MTPDAYLEVEGIRKSFAGSPAVEEATLRVPAAGTLVLLGPSGCGKTTLLRIIAGLEIPDAGEVRLEGRVLTDGPSVVAPERRHIGMVFQEPALFPHLSAARNIGFGLDRSEIAGGRIDETLEMVGLEGFGERSPATLSGGQAQRVALARALAPRPRVMLFDEPFSSLDVELKAALRSEIGALLREVGMTSVFVTHDQADAFLLGDRVAVMREGRIVQHGTPADIYSCPVDPWVATFVGEANMVPGRVENQVAVTPLGPIDVQPDISGDCEMVVRPEHIRLRDGYDGVVTAVDFHGRDSSYRVRARGVEYVVRAIATPEFRPGDTVDMAYRGPEAAAFPVPAG